MIASPAIPKESQTALSLLVGLIRSKVSVWDGKVHVRCVYIETPLLKLTILIVHTHHVMHVNQNRDTYADM